MPAPIGPASGGPTLPPISNEAIVDEAGRLTVVGLNLFQQLWAGVFGGGNSIVNRLPKSGDLKPIAGATVTDGWLLCDGATYQQTQYPDLYAAIGTTWGAAGAGTFKVPNIKGKFPIGADGSHALGSTGGSLEATILQANLPSFALTVSDPGHDHTVTDPGHDHAVTDPGHYHSGGSTPTTTNTAGAVAGTSSAANTGNATTGISIDSNTTGVTVNSNTTGISVASGGADDPLNITPPYAAVNWLIKT